MDAPESRKPVKALTAAFVRSVKAPGKYFDGHGLFLRVMPSGSRQWVQRLVIRGKRRELGLGSAELVGLAEARTAAIANRILARAGGDPLAGRQQARTMPTFSEAAAAAHSELTFSNPKDGKAFLANLETYAFPKFGQIRVCDVTGPDVRAAVMAIRDQKPEVARKLVLRVSAVMKWAIGQGHRADNPAVASVLALPTVARKARTKAHRKSLPYLEVARCVDAVNASGAWSATKLAFEFLVLTAARSGEVRAARWDEIDFGAKVWCVPAERMKMGRPHSVPLAPRAIDVLTEAKKLEDASGLVFPSIRGKPLSDMTLSKLVKDLGFVADVHGFRTSFRTWAQERTNFAFEVAEAALAHSVGDSASQAYARSDVFEKRRKMMAAWASHLAVKRGEVAMLAALQTGAA